MPQSDHLIPFSPHKSCSQGFSFVEGVCIVAIARDELPFIDEWLAYHRVLGVDHFFIYDDDPCTPLRKFLQPHSEYVTVIDWFGRHSGPPLENRQISAYSDSILRIAPYRWVAFLDIDEFIVLRRHADLPSFLLEYGSFAQISLSEHLFGHNGFFDDPPRFITKALRRRKLSPTRGVKSIVRVEAISGIANSQYCKLKPGFEHIDANKVRFSSVVYPGKSDVANINHYMCRSFSRWMGRVERGFVDDGVTEPNTKRDWQQNREACLRRFVRVIACEGNEFHDEFMNRYRMPIQRHLVQLGVSWPRHSFTTFEIRMPQQHASNYVESKAVVVYTAIAGAYDYLQKQVSDPVDFVAFLERPLESEPWKIEPLKCFDVDPVRNAKIYKVLSHQYFPHKEYSLWIDGCIQLNVPPKSIVEAFINDFDMVVHRHPDRNCSYAEASVCRRKRLDNADTIVAQMARYRDDGFPSGCGLFENTVILRRHNDRVRAFNELWWEEIRRGSRRDQLSSVYVARKVGLRVGFFPGSLRRGSPHYNGLFTRFPHLTERRLSD